jgi:hypothetical protein
MYRQHKFISTLTFCLLSVALAHAQGVVFNSNKVDYTLELPSATWKVIAEPDGVHEHTEFVNGERLDGHLQIRKEVVDQGQSPSDVARFDQEQTLRYLPGYVMGKEEKFAGRLNGVSISYEFVKNAKPMLGRIYYLQVDNRTMYTLRFTGLRDKLTRIRNQTDFIARTFRLK